MGWITTILGSVGIAVLVLSFGLYAVFQLLCGTYFKTQNLKRRYNAQWALVTGSSSGACCAATSQCGSASDAAPAVIIPYYTRFITRPGQFGG